MKKIMFNDKYGLTQAVLEGRKTMTRRIIKPDPITVQPINTRIDENGNCWETRVYPTEFGGGEYEVFAASINKNCSPYKIDEVIAIAQSYKDSGYDPDSLDRHPKDLSIRGLMKDSAGWNNKMFVKAYACKHHIKITNIKVERLQEISDEDCLKEGVFEWNAGQKDIPFYSFSYADIPDYYSPRDAFEELIDKVSGKGTWESNPYVWVYEFKLID